MCEAEERNQRALFVLTNDWGSGRIDMGLLKSILTGSDCVDHGCERVESAA